MQRSVYILIMLLFVGNYAAWGNPVNFASTRYGLTFRSHTVNQDERTRAHPQFLGGNYL